VLLLQLFDLYGLLVGVARVLLLGIVLELFERLLVQSILNKTKNTPTHLYEKTRSEEH
jgi:hypothetical protein